MAVTLHAEDSIGNIGDGDRFNWYEKDEPRVLPPPLFSRGRDNQTVERRNFARAA